MEITYKQLGINSNSRIIHVDNYSNTYCGEFKTFCGLNDIIDGDLIFLYTSEEKYPLKICKTCSKIYYKRFQCTLESFLIVLKLKGQLFIN